MEINIENLPKPSESLENIIVFLNAVLGETKSELEKTKNELVISESKLITSQTEIASYKERYARLLEEIRLSRQQRFAPSSEKNALQPDLFDEAGTVELSYEVKAQLEEDIVVSSHVRKRHPVRRPLPSDLPREIIVHDISEAEKVCHCGTQLLKIGEEVTEQLKYIPAQLSVVRHVRPKYACKPCQENVKIAPMPVLLLPKSIATAELVAHTIVAKYCDHSPLYRQEAIWRRLEIDLPRSSLCGWIIKTAELCCPLIEYLRKEMISHGYAQADETPVQVLHEVGRSNTVKSFMWCYRAIKENKTSVVFDYQETRRGDHAKNFLKDFKGYLQCDAYSGYDWCEAQKDIIRVGCMAHARRPFAELAKLTKGKGLAHDAVRWFQKLYAIEKEARERHLTAEERHQLRNMKVPPILTAFKLWLEQHLPQTSSSHKLGKAIGYTLNHWTELTAYLKDGRIEIDNNLLENTIRPFAL